MNMFSCWKVFLYIWHERTYQWYQDNFSIENCHQSKNLTAIPYIYNITFMTFLLYDRKYWRFNVFLLCISNFHCYYNGPKKSQLNCKITHFIHPISFQIHVFFEKLTRNSNCSVSSHRHWEMNKWNNTINDGYNQPNRSLSVGLRT